MDDYSLTSLNDSKNEWSARLLNILTPQIVSGIKSLYTESLLMCKNNKANNKVLMTFQNFLSRIPSWNNTIIETECKRIQDESGCTYLEDLITCIHIIQLKMLSCIRVNRKCRKIDIPLVSTSIFIHNVYINVARKLYTNVYLYDRESPSLTQQKNNREVEIIIRECILNTVRENIPVTDLLRAYLNEDIEELDADDVDARYVAKGGDGDGNESKVINTNIPTDNEDVNLNEPTPNPVDALELETEDMGAPRSIGGERPDIVPISLKSYDVAIRDIETSDPATPSSPPLSPASQLTSPASSILAHSVETPPAPSPHVTFDEQITSVNINDDSTVINSPVKQSIHSDSDTLKIEGPSDPSEVKLEIIEL